MEIDFNSKPHFGYLGSDEIETLMSNNILTIKPKKSIFKQSIGGMGLIGVGILMTITGISGLIDFVIGNEPDPETGAPSAILLFSIFGIVSALGGIQIINGPEIIEIDRKNLSMTIKKSTISIGKPRVYNIVDFFGVGSRDSKRKQYHSGTEGSSSYTTTHLVKEIFLLTSTGCIPVLFVEGGDRGKNVALEISKHFGVDFEDDIAVPGNIIKKKMDNFSHPGYPGKKYGLESGDELKSKFFAIFYNLIIVIVLGLVAILVASIPKQDSLLQDGLSLFCGGSVLILFIGTMSDVWTGKRIYVRPKHGGIVTRDKMIQGAPFGKGLISKIIERSFRKELNESMNEYELDEEGRISKDNFIKLLSKDLPNWQEYEDSSDQIKGNENKIFTLLDKDKDGFIDADSIIDFLFNMENYVNKLEPENAPPPWWSSNEKE
tara:strand:- start:10159 stop:11457 length:1299 start_codon:yes stop_codon:yes gene_type:complete